MWPFCHLKLTAEITKSYGFEGPPKTIGQHLRKKRIDAKLRQREVAAQLRAPAQSVVRWENGREEPDVKYMPAVIKFLGYDPTPVPETDGQKLMAYRVAHGWTRQKLAETLGVDAGTILRWEADVQPGFARHRRLLKEFLSGISD